MIVFDVPLHFVFTLVAGTILPLLVGLVTTRATSAAVKAIALAGLSVAANLLTELAAALQSGEEYNLGLALLAALGTFLVAVGLHYGLWKPTGATAAAQDHGRTDTPTTGGYTGSGALTGGTTLVTNRSGEDVKVRTQAQWEALSPDEKATVNREYLREELRKADEPDGPEHRADGPAN